MYTGSPSFFPWKLVNFTGQNHIFSGSSGFSCHWNHVFALNHAISAEEPRMRASALELLGDDMEISHGNFHEDHMAMDQYLWKYHLVCGMNIHFNPAILMWTEGVQGFDSLPYVFFSSIPASPLVFRSCFFFICQASNLTYAASCWLFSVGSEDADIDVLVMSKAKEPRLFVFCWARGQPSRPVAIDPSLKWWFHQLKMMIEPSQILRVVRCFCFFFFFRNLWGVKYHSLVWQWGQLGYNQPKLT